MSLRGAGSSVTVMARTSGSGPGTSTETHARPVPSTPNVAPLLADASRGLMHATVEAGDIAWVLLWSVVLVAIFAPLTMRLYRAER